MRHLRVISFALTLLAVTAFAFPAFAQKIRSYGTEAEQTYGTSADTSAVDAAQGQTGAAKVTTVDTSATAPAGEAGEGTNEVEPSYVTVFKPGGAQAPLPVDLTPDKMYSGIIPGTRDEVSQFQKARQRGENSSNRNRIIWIGFHAKDDVTRVFIQTARPADYTIGEENGAVTVTFDDTQVSAYNFRRFMDTSFFDRNVTRIETQRAGRNTVVAKIMLRSYERPDVDRSGNYVYLDFSGTKMGSENASSGSSAE